MKTLGVVCARKGSERLKDKHLLELEYDKPLVSIAAGAARHAGGLDWVVISTDDERIQKMFHRTPVGMQDVFHDAKYLIRARPADISSGTAAIEDVLLDALRFAEDETKQSFGAVVFLPGNSATVTPELINKCVARLDANSEATAVMTVREVSEPPEWMWAEGLGCQLFPAYPTDRKNAYRMQDVPKRLIATGTVNVVRSDVLRKNRSGGAYRWMGERILGVHDPDAIEVHTERDWLLAKAIFEGGK